MAGVEREGERREKEEGIGEKRKGTSHLFSFTRFSPSPFSGDCLCSTVVEISEETAQTFSNTSRLTLNCIPNLVSTVLSDPAFSQPQWLVSGPSGRGPWERGCFYAGSIIDIFVVCLPSLSSTCSRSYG